MGKNNPGQSRLARDEKKYRELFESSTDGIYISSLDGEVIDVNQSALDITGYTKKEFFNLNTVELYTNPNDRKKFQKKIKRKGFVKDYEVNLKKRDSTEINCLLSSNVRKSEEGMVIGYQGIIRDITKRKLAEEALRQSEKKYRDLFENNRDGIYVTSLDGRILDVNQSALDILGYSKKEFLKLNTIDLYVNPKERKKFLVELKKKGIVQDYEVKLRRKDGTEIFCLYLLTTTLREKSEEGNIFGYLGIIRDITDLKLTEEALRRIETRFRNLFESNRDGIYISSLDGKIIDVNPALIDILGYTRNEFFKLKTIDSYANPKDRKIFQQEIKRKGFVKDYEIKQRRKDGREIYCLLTSNIRRSENGEILGYQGIIRDITLQKRAEKLQAVSYNIAEIANKRFNTEELSRYIQQQLSVIIDTKNFYIALYDADKGLLSFPYYVDEHYPGTNYVKPRMLKKGLTEHIIKTGKALFVYDTTLKELAKKGKIEIIGPLCLVWLGAPLKSGDRIIGAIAVQSYTERNLYTKSDLELLEFVSGQIAVTIERQQAVAEIRKSEKKFRDLFEGSPDAVFVETLDGKVLDVNPAACVFHGMKHRNLVGKSFLDLIPAEHRDKVKNNYDNFISQKLDYLESFSLNYKGESVPVGIKVGRIEYEGEPALLLHVRDITKRTRAEQELQKSYEVLRNLSRHLQNAREEESIRIARDLHDSLGQVLTALKIDISLLDRQITDSSVNQKEKKVLSAKTKSMLKHVDLTIQAVRRISTHLRPVILDDMGIIPAIEWLAEDLQKRTKIKCELNMIAEEAFLDDVDIATSIFRIIQEAFTNIIRHANAAKVTLSLKKVLNKLVLKISDNGKGITKSQILNTKSYGLLGMRERVIGLGGQVSVKGKKGKGTVIKVQIPIN
ncbi:MAG: PAS domain S-box protein [Bacteroidota bacterium]